MRQARYRLNLAKQCAANARSGWSLLFIWSFSFVWLNQTDQMNHINLRSSRFSRQSRPSRLSQTSAIAPEAFAQCREGRALSGVGVSSLSIEFHRPIAQRWARIYGYRSQHRTLRLVPRVSVCPAAAGFGNASRAGRF